MRPAVIPQQVIARKRDGEALSQDELADFLDGYMGGRVGDEQMAAFLMAVRFRGLAQHELGTLVEAMLRSGRVLDRTGARPRVDKHSTGGVGDKTSLVLAPLAAEMGMVVPMMSGRGLGHTGGTLDKLESIPGLRVDLEVDELDEVLARERCVMIGATAEIAPLDRRLYALRDVTATVPSVPLITASIMSKKLAEGLDALVLDVKAGRGAFLPDLEDARALARSMADVGAARGLPVTALVTAMDRPLGRTAGNALEACEALECLAGGGPDDLRRLCVELAAEMALAGGVETALDDARRRADETLTGGAPLERFVRMARAQGGRLDPLRPGFGLPSAPVVEVAEAVRDGVVGAIDPVALGYGVIAMGGGRTRPGQTIDPTVGFELRVKTGSHVSKGQPLAVVHAASGEGASAGCEAVRRAVRVVDAGVEFPGRALPLVIDRIRSGGAS